MITKEYFESGEPFAPVNEGPKYHNAVLVYMPPKEGRPFGWINNEANGYECNVEKITVEGAHAYTTVAGRSVSFFIPFSFYEPVPFVDPAGVV